MTKFYMLTGSYDVKTSKFDKSKRRIVISNLLKFVMMVNSIKLAIISLDFWACDLKFFLIDCYLYANDQQRSLDFGLTVLQFGSLYSLFYFSNSSKKIKKFRSLDFLFYSDLNADTFDFFRKTYGLDQKSTKLFIRRSLNLCLFQQPLIFIYVTFTTLFVFRCFYLSFYKVKFFYFISLGAFFSLLTSVAYIGFATFPISLVSLCCLSIYFLIVRLKMINKSINEFNGIIHPKYFQKRKKNLKQVIQNLNSFAQHFIQIDNIYDSTLSKILSGKFQCL